MIIIIIIFLSTIFGDTDSTKNIIKTNYFDDIKFKKIDQSISDLLSKEHLDNFTGTSRYISQIQIDSIKAQSSNYIPTPINDKDTIIIETTKGVIKLQYFTEIAPKHCKNFKKLANSGYYDNTKFHRVIKSFIIQGGDILSRDSNKDNDGLGGPGWTVDAEFNNITHGRGILSMARGENPNSAGSQFFICDGNPTHLDGKYSAFGKVIEGMRIVDLIANTPTKYTSTILRCFSQIPNNEDPEGWIELIDLKTRTKIFSKIPHGEDKIEYKRMMSKDIRSDQPISSVIIKRIRVLDYHHNMENRDDN